MDAKKTTPYTPEQFAALAELARLRPGSGAYESARLVVFEGLTAADAAERTGITRQGSAQVMRKLKKVAALVKIAEKSA